MGQKGSKEIISSDKSVDRADIKSLAYGQCIGKSYQEVQKGMCETEFKAFKECVQVSSLYRHLSSSVFCYLCLGTLWCWHW